MKKLCEGTFPGRYVLLRLKFAVNSGAIEQNGAKARIIKLNLEVKTKVKSIY